MEYRIEKDSLGEVQVPQGALYGAQTMRAVRNFPISFRTVPAALIRNYLRLKLAAAKANLICGVLDQAHSDLITRAVKELLAIPESRWAEIYPVDIYQAGAGTSQNMNINEVIANTANQILGAPLGSYSPIHPNDQVNRSQSTNDTFPTAMRLALLEVSLPLQRSLEELASSLESKGLAWGKILKSARTHLQDAVPMRLGEEFQAYACTVRRCATWLQNARDGLRELGIGGSAAGSGLTVPTGFVPEILNELEKLCAEKLRGADNLFEAMQSQAPVMYYSSILRLTALEMTRICNDLRLLASGPMTGLAEIFLPPVQPGSSIMPGKVNPSILEMTNQTWFAVLGHDQTVAYAMQAGQLELNVMMPIMATTLIEATSIATHATQVLREKCIDGLRANERRLRTYFENTPQVATALSPLLGYEKTAEIVAEALATGRSVFELVRAKKLLTEQELNKILNAF